MFMGTTGMSYLRRGIVVAVGLTAVVAAMLLDHRVTYAYRVVDAHGVVVLRGVKAQDEWLSAFGTDKCSQSVSDHQSRLHVSVRPMAADKSGLVRTAITVCTGVAESATSARIADLPAGVETAISLDPRRSDGQATTLYLRASREPWLRQWI